MKPPTRAGKPNQQERASRQATIDVLLQRALRGVLTIPEAAVLADYVRAERRNADKTRQSLALTTRALERHRQAADAEIQRLESRITELTSQQNGSGIPGDVADQILLDAANVASCIAAQLCERGQIDKASGALTVMAELRQLAGAAPEDSPCPQCPATPDPTVGSLP